MNFETSEITKQVAQTARDFAQQYIRPHVMEWDESQEFPLHIFKEMGKLGLMGVLVPENYGGSGLTYFEYKAVIEEIAKVCGSIGLGCHFALSRNRPRRGRTSTKGPDRHLHAGIGQ